VVPIAHPQLEGFRMVRSPLRIGGRAMAAMVPPPGLDEHRTEILALLEPQLNGTTRTNPKTTK
jgi:hypothetical protein